MFIGASVPANAALLVQSVIMQSLAELPFIAGDVALDFVNTAELRDDPLAGDVLVTPADLVGWGRRYGLLGERPGDADAVELRAAVETRELLYRLFVARVDRVAAAPADLKELAEAAAEAYATARLVAGEDARLRWSWDPTRPTTVRHTATISAIELLRDGRLERLKQCPGDHCGWLFLDATKRGNRRWCSMRECGQDAKTARRRRPAADR
jgi:predicted RNA-binding Zn ribbon-like protein